ncbi:Set domain containing hypothetical protein [Phytophthora palmivora]|uniref:SET domain-containing protein n=1 Tax=Phytophthora palmivora TaxID=4796 RepID=A0A2P4XFF8_9STRA|nr:Set domain containing hypothetical protein [Phytophthora palmivora]
MPGLSASELPPETLHAGDTLEYFCQAFVCGDQKGHRIGIVTKVDATKGAEYPVDVDTGDIITRTMMTKRLADRFGKPFTPDSTKWRKMRTYDLAVEEELTMSESETLGSTVSDESHKAATAYLRTIPSRYARDKKRQQAKRRKMEWLQPRSLYTSTDLDIGNVVGEYCWKLSEFPAVVHGQPDQAVKQNSGHTLLYNAKSIKKNYVYVDALKCGSITRFVSHACDPNAAFVQQQTRCLVKVLVKMIKDVKAGAQITVHYGNERWFKCACDDCWEERYEDDGEGDDD